MWESILNVIQNILNILSNVSTSLMNNELFRIMIGVIIFGIVIFLIFRILKEGVFAWHGKNEIVTYIDKKGRYVTINKKHSKKLNKYYKNYRKYKKYKY